jgi:hypothetical protein
MVPKKNRGVSPKMIARSRASLSESEDFDVDTFFKKINVSILDEPLGNTIDCLSANEIADFVTRDELSAARRLHVGECQDCQEMINIYRLACEEQPTPLNDLEIIRSEQIWIPEGGSFFLILANRGEKPVFRDLDLKTAEAKGAIVASGCEPEELDPSPYEATEAVKLCFRSHNVTLPRAPQNAPVPGWLTICARSQQSGRQVETPKQLVNVRQEFRVSFDRLQTRAGSVECPDHDLS